jgi:uncharacterized protein YbaA (DUF1428 family)
MNMVGLPPLNFGLPMMRRSYYSRNFHEDDTVACEGVYRESVNQLSTGAAMSYIDGFVIAVPKGNKQKFIDHAKQGDSVFMENGAKRVLECWGDDVKDGNLTDFRRAVQAKDDEVVVFSWIEWPDKATRDAAMTKVMSDSRLSPQGNPMPFDGKRMIFGGFAPVLELGGGA